MDNPYAAPATAIDRSEATGPVFFKAGHIAAVTFFGSGVVGGICLCIAEWQNDRRVVGVWLLVLGVILAVGSFALRSSPPLKILGLPYNILIAFLAYKYVTSRITAAGGPTTIRFMSGWWTFLVLMLYVLVVVGVIVLVVSGV